MQLTNAEVVAAAEAVGMLSEISLPALLAAKVARMRRVLGPQASIVIKYRNIIIKKYTKRGDDGKPLPVHNEAGELQPGQVLVSDVESLRAELDEYDNGQVELDCPTIAFSELNLKDKKGNDREFPPIIIYSLGPLFVDKQDAVAPTQ